MSAWTDPTWRAEAEEWIREHLARLGMRAVGAIDQSHVYPWSTVMRVETQRGAVYFKANARTLRHEAALVRLLSDRRPDCVPPPLAVDLERGWILMADAGVRLRELIDHEHALARWLDVLPLYGGLQIDLMPDPDRLVWLGVPDLRLDVLPRKYEAMLDDLRELPPNDRRRLAESVTPVGDMCCELAAYGVPETVQHDDFHDGQVFVRDGRYVLLDWGDACVSHPFFTMAVTLEGVISWGMDEVPGSTDVGPFRDAYLAPFERVAPGADLRAACALAMRLGWICRAVNAYASEPDPARTHARLRMFLDGRP